MCGIILFYKINVPLLTSPVRGCVQVMDCYVEDCTLGKGFYRTEAGAQQGPYNVT